MNNNETKECTYSDKLEKMQQFYKIKQEVQKNIRNSQTLSQAEIIHFHQDNPHIKAYLDEIKQEIRNDEVITAQLSLQGLSYFQLKEKIHQIEQILKEENINETTLRLDQILMQSQISMQPEQKQLIYVEVLTLCNNYVEIFLKQAQNAITVSHNVIMYNHFMSLSHQLISKCDIWTHHEEHEQLMRVITLINLGVFHKMQKKIAVSIEDFSSALSIILAKQYTTKLGIVYFYLAQLNSQTGAHDKAIQFARKALEQNQHHFMKVVQPSIPVDRMQQDQLLLHRSQKDKEKDLINNPKLIKTQAMVYNNNGNAQVPEKKRAVSEPSAINQDSIQVNNMIYNNQKQGKESQHVESIVKKTSFLEWSDSNIMNLIYCYEILAFEEEYYLNYVEAYRLYSKAVSVAQEKFGVGHQVFESYLQKYISFQKRQALHTRTEQQNVLNQFSHLQIRPLIEQSLKHKDEIINTHIQYQLRQKNAGSLRNLFSRKKASPNSVLRNSPYNEKIVPYQPLYVRVQSKTRSESLHSNNPKQQQSQQLNSKRTTVTVVRQKKLNLDSLPSNLKFNMTNGTVHTQSSIISNSTATTKKKNLTDRKYNFYSSSQYSSELKRKPSLQSYEQTLQKCSGMRVGSPLSQQVNWESKTSRGTDMPFQESLSKWPNCSNTSLYNEGPSSIYPPPRLIKGRDIHHTLRQRNPSSVVTQNSDAIRSIIDNQHNLLQQTQFNSTKNSMTKYPNQKQAKGATFGGQPLKASPSHVIKTPKSSLQNFVDQMKLKGVQVNQQNQQLFMKLQIPTGKNQSPLFEILGQTHSKLQKTPQAFNHRKIQIYSEVRTSGLKQGYLNNVSNQAEQFLQNRIEINNDFRRKKTLSLHNQQQQQQQPQDEISSQKTKNMFQKENIQLQLLNKLKTEDNSNFTGNINNNNNNDHCSTTNTITPTHSNSIYLLPNQNHIQTHQDKDKTYDFYRKKSISVVSKSNAIENIQNFFTSPNSDITQYQIIYSLDNCKLLVRQGQVDKDNNQQSQGSINKQFLEGNIKYFLSNDSMIIYIQFSRYNSNQNMVDNLQSEEVNRLIQSEQKSVDTYEHSINVSDLYSLNTFTCENKLGVLIKICERINEILSVDLTTSLLAISHFGQTFFQSQKQDNTNSTHNKDPRISKLLEFPNEGISLNLVLKDQKSSIIYCSDSASNIKRSTYEMLNSNGNFNQEEEQEELLNKEKVFFNSTSGELQGSKQVVCSFYNKGNQGEQIQQVVGGNLNPRMEETNDNNVNLLQNIQNISEIQDTNHDDDFYEQSPRRKRQNKTKLSTEEAEFPNQMIQGYESPTYTQGNKRNSSTSNLFRIHGVQNGFDENSKINAFDFEIEKEKRQCQQNTNNHFEEQGDKQITLQGSVKFITYYQVPSVTDSSDISNQNALQFVDMQQQSNSLKNSTFKFKHNSQIQPINESTNNQQ